MCFQEKEVFGRSGVILSSIYQHYAVIVIFAATQGFISHNDAVQLGSSAADPDGDHLFWPDFLVFWSGSWFTAPFTPAISDLTKL